jgi:hypothetical protein
MDSDATAEFAQTLSLLVIVISAATGFVGVIAPTLPHITPQLLVSADTHPANLGPYLDVI